MKKKFRFIISICVVLILLCSFSGCDKIFYVVETFPDSGTWYSEDLQLYLTFERDARSLAIIDGKEVECAACYMDGGTNITVVGIVGGYPSDKEILFRGKSVTLSETELVLHSYEDNELYAFVPITGHRTGDG